MGFRNFSAAIFLVVISFVARLGFADAKDVKLPIAAYDIAVNPETGAVAAVDPENNTVALFPKLSSGANVDEVDARETPKMPVSIVYKQAGDKKYFAVICHDAQKMLVLDTATMEKVKEISLEISSPSLALASTSPEDPFVYYCGGRGHDSAVGRVNLLNFVDEGKIPIGDSVMDAAISADGKILYTRGPWSPSGFRAVKIEPAAPGVAKPTITPLFYDHRSIAPYFPDVAGQYCATGRQLFTADLKKTVAELSVAPVSFAANRPIAAGVKNKTLVVLSLNTFKDLASVAIPANLGIDENQRLDRARSLQVRNGQARFKRFDFHTRVVHDPKNDCFILVNDHTAAVVKLSDLNLPKEPMLTTDVRGSQVFNVGRTAKLAIVPRDASVKLELKSGPKGMKLSGNDREWTPGADDVGVASVSVRVYAGELERTMALELPVRRPEISLDFVPGQMVLSQNGKWVALLETFQNRMEIDPGRQQQADDRSSRIKIIDAEKLTSVADKSILSNFTSIGVDDRFVYASLADSDAFYVLKREDLSEVKRIFTNGKARSFVSVGEQTLYVTAERETIVLKLPELTPISSPSPAQVAQPTTRPVAGFRRAAFAAPTTVAPEWNGVGWELNGAEYDAQLAKILNVHSISGPLMIGTPSAAGQRWQNPAAYQEGLVDKSHWGIIASPNGLVREGNQQIGQFNSQATVVLPNQPAAVSLVSSAGDMYGRKNSARNKSELIFRDLLTAHPGIVLPLFDEPLDPQRMQRQRFGQRSKLAARGDTIAALVGDRLFIVSPPKLDPEKFPVPLHVSSNLGVVTLDPQRPVTLAFIAEGGAAPIEYALGTEQPGIEIDKSTGVVTLTAKTIIEHATPQLLEHAMRIQAENRFTPPEMRHGGMDGASRAVDPSAIVAKARESGAAEFRRLTGRDPAGIPATLVVSVIARDKNLQSATQTQSVLVDLPAEPVMAALREQQRQQQEQEQEQEQQRAAAAAAARPPATRPADDDALERRVADLEDRIRRLDAKIDLLTQILTDERKKQGK